MKRKQLLGFGLGAVLFVFGCIAFVGCSDNSDASSCSPGSANCECYGNGTCDDGLNCVDGTCVDPTAGRDGGPRDGGSTGPMGSGESTTETIGPSGGDVSVAGCSVSFPEGALGEDKEITVTERVDPAPGGYDAYSPVCKFEPSGLQFQKPVEISIGFDGDSQIAAMFWSRPEDQGGGYERLGGRIAGERVVWLISFYHSIGMIRTTCCG